MSLSPIANVEVIPIVVDQVDHVDLDTTTETVIVRITDENGLCGIGEADAPGTVVKAFIEMPTAHLLSRNMIEVLVGSDPLEAVGLWQKLYDGTCYPGRRGLGIHALSAIDIALYDLAGKQIGVPAYKLLGGARRQKLRPYCTIYPGLAHGRTIRELMRIIEEQLEKAISIGFRAVKMEVLFYELVSDRELVNLIKEGRRMIGEDILLALDFGYRWNNWHDAKWVLDQLGNINIYFAEATLQHDDLIGHAKLAQSSAIRICGAEFAATRWEVREWVETGLVSVVQPDISRCGGLTEIRRIADYCELMGAQVIPHGWKTGILTNVGCHFQAACAAAPLFEYVSPDVFDSILRRELVAPEPVLKDGEIDLPTKPGLGIELNEEIVERYRRDH